MTKKKNKRQPEIHSTKTSTPQVLTKDLINFLNSKPQQSHTAKQLAKQFGIKTVKGKNTLMATLEGLVKEGKLVKPTSRHYTAVTSSKEIIGTVDYVNPSYAYIIPDLTEDDDVKKDDIRISSRNLKGALHGDKVSVKLYKSNHQRPSGEVKAIVERVKTAFVGTIQILPKYAFVVVDDRKVHTDFFVALSELNGAKNGQKVIVEMLEWGPRDKNPTGKVIQVLGEAGEHDTEIHAIMFEFGLPFEFPDGLEDKARAIEEDFSEETLATRKDFRGITTFTIDPLTAKDFDDAISIRKLENGHWEIGVHIADVTHYVKDGPLEAEAKKRATSVYLVDRTIPMLPEKISNELCSLRPHEDKLTFSAVFELDEEANMKKEWFGRTIIHSDRRFTYEEAQERIESKEGDFAQEIITLNNLAKKMKVRRFEEGAISFETVEFVFQLGDDGKTPLGMKAKVRQDAHKLVEEFMLLANKRVATFVYDLKKTEPRNHMVYRIHDDPDPDRVTEFAAFAKRFGYTIDIRPDKLAYSLNKLTEEIEGKPEQNILENQAIRTMSKAKYTTEPTGHYGLGFKHYTHFTSPIRRYPDMMAHRLLQHYLDNGSSVKAATYEELCKHSSAMEKRASDAERASVKYKQVEYMKQFEGQEMAGVIGSLTDWGMFIELTETRCEGMIRLADIAGDFYQFEREKQRVIGYNTKRIFQIGDAIRVKIREAIPEKRTLDLDVVLDN